jgi:hypothetical protein
MNVANLVLLGKGQGLRGSVEKASAVDGLSGGCLLFGGFGSSMNNLTLSFFQYSLPAEIY